MACGGTRSGAAGHMKILLDMNLTPSWVQFLQQVGFEAIHWSKVGRHDASDEEIMGFADKNNFVVLTHDLDFSAILAATKGKKPSVIQLRARNISPESLGHERRHRAAAYLR